MTCSCFFFFSSEIILLPNYRFFPFLGSVIYMALFLNTATNLLNLPTLKEPKMNVTLFSRHRTLKKWIPRRRCPLVWFQHARTKQVLSVSSGSSRNPADRASGSDGFLWTRNTVIHMLEKKIRIPWYLWRENPLMETDTLMSKSARDLWVDLASKMSTEGLTGGLKELIF